MYAAHLPALQALKMSVPARAAGPFSVGTEQGSPVRPADDMKQARKPEPCERPVESDLVERLQAALRGELLVSHRPAGGRQRGKHGLTSLGSSKPRGAQQLTVIGLYATHLHVANLHRRRHQSQSCDFADIRVWRRSPPPGLEPGLLHGHLLVVVDVEVAEEALELAEALVVQRGKLDAVTAAARVIFAVSHSTSRRLW
jgi:hypothetical protein